MGEFLYCISVVTMWILFAILFRALIELGRGRNK